MVLYERVNRCAVGGKAGYFVGLGNDDLSVKDVVIGIVAAVDDEREVYHKTAGDAMAVGAGIGLVGRNAVVGQKLSVALAVDDDAPAGALHVGSDIEPPAHEVQVVVLHGVWINRDRGGENRPVGVFRVVFAPMNERQECY